MNDIKNKLKIYLNSNLDDTCIFIEEDKFVNFCAMSMVDISVKTNNINIDDYLNNHNNYSDFQTTLFNFIDKKNLKDSDVYNKVHIDRRLFSKIRGDKNYHPSKETIILLAISLELDEKELEQLLDSASYSLPKNNKYDLIIRFCFINKIFKLTDVNELLYEYNCKLFNQ